MQLFLVRQDHIYCTLGSKYVCKNTKLKLLIESIIEGTSKHANSGFYNKKYKLNEDNVIN